MNTTWAVYGSQPPPVRVTREKAARDLARKYNDLGMRATLYELDEDEGVIQQIRIEDGTETTLPPEED